jgi:FtsH-binding integral membrane protein
MNDPSNPYASWGMVAAEADTNDRARFIRLTYIHLFAAIVSFIGLEAILLNTPTVTNAMAGVVTMPYGWLIVMALFIGASYLANYWASSSTSVGMQYAGLALYVVAWSVMFVPLLMIAQSFTDQTGTNVIGIAAGLTIFTFLALTAIVFVTGADFAFLGPFLGIASLIAMGVILVGIVFSLPLFNLLFIGALLLLSAGYILYDTSNVLHHYRVGQHVAAALALFASVALMFWYMVQLVMSVTSRD